MKNIIFIIAVFLQVCLVNGQEEAAFATSSTHINKIINDNVAMGLSSAVTVNGEVVRKENLGYANQENQIPFTETTKTRIASIVKPMTAIAVLQLYEQGLVDLEAPIQTYVSDFPVKKEGVITVRHIMNHSAGIKAYQSNKEMSSTIEYASLTAAMSVFKDWDIISAPGITERYTTYGYVVLGVLIERVSGMSYEDYMQKNIWDVAGMTHTAVEKFGVNYSNKSLLYERKGKRKIKVFKKQNNLSNRVSGGGVYSTMEDVLKFGQAVLDYKLLSKETSDLMAQQQDVAYDGNPYALGWYLYGKTPVLGHGGTQRGCSAQLMIIREKNMVSVILTNTSGAWQDVINGSILLLNDAIDEDKRMNPN